MPNYKFGDNVPRRGNIISKMIGRVILKITGWQYVGNPPDVSRFVVVAAPHTSNWDGFFGFSAIFATGIRLHWMGKHTLFKGVMGKIMIWLGGVPIRRDANYGAVKQIVEEFRKRSQFAIAITPEGTRKKVEKWKTGFYTIALQAGVPIAVALLDYQKKQVGFGPYFTPSGDKNKDFEFLMNFYSQITPRYPEQFNSDFYR